MIISGCEVNPQRMNSKVNIKCIICKKRIPEPLFNVHQCTKSYDCNICEKTFTERKVLAYHKRTHKEEKPYSCDVCQKSYSHSSSLTNHNKTASHIERTKSKNTNIPITQSSFIDCGESIKEEDIKGEVKEEESVDDPLTIQKEKASDESENIITEVKEEGIRDDPLCVQGLNNSGDVENNTVVDEIDILQHKIETDI